MSYIERDVTLSINGKTAKFDDMIYIFKGDRDIQLNIKIIDTKMKFSRTNVLGNVLTPLPKGCYAKVGLVKPKGDTVIRDRVAIEDDKVKFLIDSTVCDELDEVGIHKIQIQIYALDDDTSPRWTLPSAAELEVCEPDIDFDGITPIVGLAKAGLSLMTVEGDTTIVDFNPDGTYNKTTWINGDIITVANLNKIENAIEKNTNDIKTNKLASNVTIIDEGNHFASENAEGALQELGQQCKEKAKQSELEVQKARIDSFTKLSEGSTTGDDELTDIRVMANGKIATSAGSAVRKQYEVLTEDLTNLCEDFYDSNKLKDGYFLDTIGNEHAFTGLAVTDFIPCNFQNKIYCASSNKKSSGIPCCILYDENKDYLSCVFADITTAWTPFSFIVTNKKAKYLKYNVLKSEQNQYLKVSLNKNTINNFIEKLYSDDLKSKEIECHNSPTIFLVDGDYMPVYFSNYLDNYSDYKVAVKKVRQVTGGMNGGFRLKDGYVFKANINELYNNPHPSCCVMYNYNDKEIRIDNEVKVISKDTGSGLFKKVVVIGDSLTNAGTYVGQCATRFASDVMNVEFIGTLGSGTEASPYREGRSGWNTCAYITKQTFSNQINAFWNPTTSKFDFSYYCNTYNMNPDIVFLNLGTNEITVSVDGKVPTIVESKAYFAEIIESIKAYNTNIKICIWLCPIPCQVNGGEGKYERMSVISMIYETYKNVSGIYLMPVYPIINDDDYPHSYQNISTNAKEMVYTDELHFGKSGHEKIGNLMYGMIKYIGSL